EHETWQCAAPQRVQVLAEAAAHLSPVTVHPNIERSWRGGDEQPHPSLLRPPGQRDVLQHLTRYGFVTARGRVGRTGKGEPLSISHSQRGRTHPRNERKRQQRNRR